jgi:20S proteasome alpha/beta subunit
LTVLVGIYCKDGVVVGADSAATSSSIELKTIEQPIDKIDVIEDTMVIAGTGSVGLGQRFVGAVRTQFAKKAFVGKLSLEYGKQLSAICIDDFGQTQTPEGFYSARPGQYGALVAFVAADKRPYLCELDPNNLQPELKNDRMWYVSLGSGQLIVDPFLALMRQAFWSDGPPSLADGIFATTWAIQHAIDTNPGGVNSPINIAVLEKSGNNDQSWCARKLSADEISEHQDNVCGAIRHLGAYRELLQKPREGLHIPKLGGD